MLRFRAFYLRVSLSLECKDWHRLFGWVIAHSEPSHILKNVQLNIIIGFYRTLLVIQNFIIDLFPGFIGRNIMHEFVPLSYCSCAC